MQISCNYYFNNNVYKSNKNSYVSFKSEQAQLVSPKVLRLLKESANLDNIYNFQELNSVNKFIVPLVHKKINSCLSNALLNMTIVADTKQLTELLGEKAKDYIVSSLEGICITISDNDDLEKCNTVYETTVCLVPSSINKTNLSEYFCKILLHT